MQIRPATDADARQIADICNWYILNTTATFFIDAFTVMEMAAQIQEKQVKYNWLVAESAGEIIGYAYYGAFRPRAAYSHTVESTIYLKQGKTGQGIGSRLYTCLLESAAAKGYREAVAVIAMPNPESIALHQKMGFKESGVLQNVGYKFEQYLDITLWQRTLVPAT